MTQHLSNASACYCTGDELVRVNGQQVQGMPLDVVRDKIKGPVIISGSHIVHAPPRWDLLLSQGLLVQPELMYIL